MLFINMKDLLPVNQVHLIECAERPVADASCRAS